MSLEKIQISLDIGLYGQDYKTIYKKSLSLERRLKKILAKETEKLKKFHISVEHNIFPSTNNQ